jgi:hypothetical protein
VLHLARWIQGSPAPPPAPLGHVPRADRDATHPAMSDTQTLDAHPFSPRDAGRALARLTSLLHASQVLSMQETLDFACCFIDEALTLLRVCLTHDRAPGTLIWDAEAHLDATPLPGDASSSGMELALDPPLAGTLRIDGTHALLGDEVAFLRQAVLLLSLALDRCPDIGASTPRHAAMDTSSRTRFRRLVR